VPDGRIVDFYAGRSFAPIWTNGEQLSPAANAIVAVMQAAANEGLQPQNYTVQENVGSTPQALASRELQISRAVVRLAEHRSRGHLSPSALGDDYQRPAKLIAAPAGLLARVAQATDPVAALAAFNPDTADFQRLLDGFAKLQQVVANGGWPTVAAGPILRPGMTDLRVPALRRALRVHGDLTAAADAGSPLFDEGLVDAVRHFQHRHGLGVDGAVGAETLAALNVRAAVRLRQVALNLDRRRWLPNYPLGRHFVVNLPSFEVELMEGEQTIFSTPTVVGSRKFETPEFSADMTYVVLNPYWNVPPSIATKEILPKMQADPDYLVRKNMRLYEYESNTQIDPLTVDWRGLERMPFRVRQDTGSDNSLGLVKFMLPNRYNIYLHDTNQKALFSQTMRALSHGCVRLADPVGLVEVLLGQQTGWTKEDLIRRMDGAKEQVVSLHRRVPVRIVYHTAWVDKAGVFHFRPDVYGRDAKLDPGV
jgi:L,D-transpeptidase YcbB